MQLADAYFDCRRTKRNTNSALAFEINLEDNLFALYEELKDGTYQPGPSICFVITRPKPREVWAAQYRDRIVHWLLYNQIAERFHKRFIADSCACIPGRGTLYAVRRLEAKVRSHTQNWSRPGYYLKMDLANFFVSINKHQVLQHLGRHVHEAWWLYLADQILFHDPRPGVVKHGSNALFSKIPGHKSLFNAPRDTGLPIGNLSSQFFANVLLDALDQYVKQTLKVKHYIRYVDDFVILGESTQQLTEIRRNIETWLPANLDLRINPAKTILQPIDRGIDFAGQVIKPWHTRTRRRTFNEAISRVASIDAEQVFQTSNSYFGLFRQANHSHTDRARLANVLRKRGRTINTQLTQTYRPSIRRTV